MDIEIGPNLALAIQWIVGGLGFCVWVWIINR